MPWYSHPALRDLFRHSSNTIASRCFSISTLFPSRVSCAASATSAAQSLGFPNKGLEYAVGQIERALPHMDDTPIIANVSGDAPDEIAPCHARLEPLTTAIGINISSPNTRGLRTLQRPDDLCALLDALNRNRGKPLFVKLPRYADSPSADGARKEDILALARVCVERGVDALTVANALPIQNSKLVAGAGGLSGKSLLASTLTMIAEISAKRFNAPKP